MQLKNISSFLGQDLDYVNSTQIQITNGLYANISDSDKAIDCQGLVLIPGLINCHTHIGDSIAKDISLQVTVDQKIHPVIGIKQKILSKTKPEHLVSFMVNTCNSMLRKGTTTFVDFREGGLDGLDLLRQALQSTPVHCVVLGRFPHYHDSTQIKQNESFSQPLESEFNEIVESSDGIGVSGTNENSDSMLQHFSKSNKLKAIHAAETIQSAEKSICLTDKTETQRAMNLKPDFLVHMTHATTSDLNLAATKTRGIVVCPRANAALAEGIPDVIAMLDAGCCVGIGTDNIMINSPDMFREMDYLWKVTMGIHKHHILPKDILKMATVNAGMILGRNIGSIQPGMIADGIFIEKHSIDLEPMLDPHASVVHRASESSIRAIMIQGEIVHGKI